MADGRRITRRELFETRLMDAVRAELHERGLDEPYELAQATGKYPATCKEILKREHWDAQLSLWIVETLDLPIHVIVRTGPRGIKPTGPRDTLRGV